MGEFYIQFISEIIHYQIVTCKQHTSPLNIANRNESILLAVIRNRKVSLALARSQMGAGELCAATHVVKAKVTRGCTCAFVLFEREREEESVIGRERQEESVIGREREEGSKGEKGMKRGREREG